MKLINKIYWSEAVENDGGHHLGQITQIVDNLRNCAFHVEKHKYAEVVDHEKWM